MKKVITERDVIESYKTGSKNIAVNSNDIITPLAKEKINDLGIKITTESGKPVRIGSFKVSKIAIGSDHTGFNLKEFLKKILADKSVEIIDVGTNSEDSCDYPDFALSVAYKVTAGEADCGIILDATGIPSAITANKIPGIRAATCYNEFTAWSARNHNNANILVMGAKTLGDESAKSILDKWLTTDFEGGRHQRRLDKITRIEDKLFNKK